MDDGEIVLINSGKCPFISGEEFSAVSDSLSSAESTAGNKLMWAPEIDQFQLKNYQTGESISVTGPLPNIYKDCRHHVCTSTLMSLAPHANQNKSNSSNVIDELESHSVDYIRKEAYDYLQIFHKDKNTSEADYKKRLEQVKLEIEHTRSYVHTTDEIEYGCQLAWRNAARCINRLFWRDLTIIDRRDVKTNRDMFKEICDHIRVGYNNGTLQASVLVFSPRARMWSTQYLRYACYEQADGTLLGDPANLPLTKAALQLGWNIPETRRTQWDLLPIIVQVDPNEPPSWYELPQDLRLEVVLSHADPKYDAAIKKLGLRWVVQPIVCDNAFEIGGIFYRCVPFSGWFMETEIGRNLCDIQRYNIIPKLAALLNLDITIAANSQLNVDRLYLEINAAALYSFQKAKITIVDHHTAAAGFMKFMKQEAILRGNTPADWVWLVPPISSGMSSLFHQEMLNYVLKPRLLSQRDPWTYYVPFLEHKQNPTLSTENIRSVLSTTELRISIHVLYASASGTAQSYAEQMVKRLKITGYNAIIMELDAYSFEQTNKNTPAIIFIITSTFGKGNAPEGGKKVEQWLQNVTDIGINNSTSNMKHISLHNNPFQSSEINKFPLHWCSYAVCAIGSSAYPFFCGFGKLVDTSFQLFGAHRLAPFATCDALNQQYKSYNEWEENTVIALKAAYPYASSREKDIRLFALSRPPSTRRQGSYVEQQVNLIKPFRPTPAPLIFNTNNSETIPSEPVGLFTKENPYLATVLQNIELTGSDNSINDSGRQDHRALSLSENIQPKKKVTIPSSFTNASNDQYRSVRLIVLDTTDLDYHPGDHVCILPENTLANVNGVITACGWQLGNKLLIVPCSLSSYTNGKYQTLRQILTNFVDLTTPLRPHTLNIIATYAKNTNEQRQLMELGKGGQRYTDWIVNSPTVKETLEMFRSIQIPLEELIQLLPPLQPRYYSISSSTNCHPNQLHITVSVVTYTTSHGVLRKGICSNYLQQTLPKLSPDGKPIHSTFPRKPSRVRLFISPNPHFRLPGQDSLSIRMTRDMLCGGDAFLPLNSPLLMFAVGSGIAPYRAFWQELEFLEQSQGSVQVERVLFMGCRSSSDFLYAKELQSRTSQRGESNKLFTAVIPVYSRENAVVKRYIQDVMLEYEDMIYSILSDDNAFVYMCGSTRSCQGIESTLASILQSCGEDNLTFIQATNLVKQYKQFGRIKQVMFG
ncbi:unnamed protein product [Adineta steineri]|uniref:Nitric oxide synthase n=1 Tax=Adineta steineri TaxID=433720 RepID=A0A819G8Z1_9BILA|nr:unnamed protein product [Adineta steineri]